MVPIQLWLPSVMGGVQSAERQRDITRAHEAWDKENALWMIPGWSGPKVWKVSDVVVGAVASEELEYCDILHIGNNQQVVGTRASAFPNRCVKELLNHWLQERNQTCMIPIDRQDQKRTFAIEVPVPVDGGVIYTEQFFEIENVSSIPVSKTDNEKLALSLAVGEKPGDARPVSPELETQRGRYLDQTSSLNARLVWTAPFGALAPKVLSLDDLHARSLMRSLAEDANSDPGKALNEARTRSKPWLSEGTSTELLAWFIPILLKEGELGALMSLEARFDIQAQNLHDAYQLPDCMKALSKPKAVRRAWGVTGLMWALFIDELETGLGFNFCKRCGSRIVGPVNRQYCSRKQNPKCRRGYDAERKRAARKSKK